MGEVKKAIFENVELIWKGETYVIPANKVLGCIANVESIITFAELQAFAQRSAVPVAHLAQAYGAALRYAGAKVSDDEVYIGVFQGQGASEILSAVSNIMLLMIPPSLRRELADEAAKQKAAEESKPGN